LSEGSNAESAGRNIHASRFISAKFAFGPLEIVYDYEGWNDSSESSQRAFQELIKVGLVEDTGYKIYSAQAAGCAPIINALQKGTDEINPVKPNTIASSIAIGNPADGYYVLQAVRETGGWGESVTDQEILEGIHLLAQTEGIFTEPAGGTEVAVTKKLIQNGRIPREESIVISITGNGYKTLEAVARRVEKPLTITATLESFDGTLRTH
jgi:threonine synthase